MRIHNAIQREDGQDNPLKDPGSLCFASAGCSGSCEPPVGCSVAVWPSVTLRDSAMEPVRATDPGEVGQAACPARLCRRMRRNLARALLNRMDKPRAEQALRLLTGLAPRATIAIVQEQGPDEFESNTLDARPIGVVAAWPARDISTGAGHGSTGPVLDSSEARFSPDRPETFTTLLPCFRREAIPSIKSAGMANQDSQRKGNRHGLE